MVEVKADEKGVHTNAGQLGRKQQELHCSNPSCAILRSTRPNGNEYQEQRGDPHAPTASGLTWKQGRLRCMLHPRFTGAAKADASAQEDLMPVRRCSMTRSPDSSLPTR
jgi:hypothetical protein